MLNPGAAHGTGLPGFRAGFVRRSGVGRDVRRRAMEADDLDLFRRREGDGGTPRIGFHLEGAVWTTVEDADFAAWLDAGTMQKAQEFRVALKEAADGAMGAFGRVGQRDQAPVAALVRRLRQDEIAVGAGSLFAQLFDQQSFESGGDGVLEALGLVVDLVPGHAEDLREHALDEVVAEGGAVGGFASGGGEAEDAVVVDFDKSIAAKAAKGHGDSRRRDGEPVGEGGRDHGASLALGFENRLEVVFLRNGDGRLHGWSGFQINAEEPPEHQRLDSNRAHLDAGDELNSWNNLPGQLLVAGNEEVNSRGRCTGQMNGIRSCQPLDGS